MEQCDVNLGFREDGSPEGVDGKREKLIQRTVQGVEQTSEWFGTARAGDHTIESGLRRRFVPDHSETLGGPTTFCKVIPTAMESTGDCFFEAHTDRGSGNYEMKHLGSVSRRILEPEKSNLDHPHKTKKEKGAKDIFIVPRFNSVEHIKTIFVEKLKKRKLFVTGDDFTGAQVDAYPMFALRDFVVYLIFMSVVCIIVFGSQGTAHNYYADVIRKLLINSSYNSSLGQKLVFGETRNRHDIWIFIIDVLLKVLYDKAYVFSRRRVIISGFRVQTENLFFGAPQLRQLRVRGKTCEPVPMFQGVFEDCADYYSEGIEDKEAFGSKTTAWRYTPPPKEQSYYKGIVSTYPEGGFIMNFTTWENFTLDYILELRNQDWIRFGTRAVFVDFVLYNPNTNLFCVCKLLFELPPFGGIIPSYQFSTLKLLRYVEPWDFFILACMIIFICFTLYYTFEEFMQIIRLREAYLSNWWNILDVMTIFSSYLAITFGIVSVTKTRHFLAMNVDKIHTQNHVPFDDIVNTQLRFDISMALVVIIVWTKILKFSTLNRNASLILTAILRAGPAIILVTLISMSLMVGFAIFGNVLFGTFVARFRKIEDNIFTMLTLVTGGLVWRNDVSDHGIDYRMIIYTIILFLLFRVIILNIYVVLIVNGFHEEVRELNELSNTATIGDVIREVFCKFLIFIGQHKMADNIDEREIIKQNIRIYDALAMIIRRHGYDSLETDLILEKHGVSYGLPITKKTMVALYDDIHVRNQLSLETESHDKLKEHIEEIDKIILVTDQTLMGLMTKVNVLTDNYLQERGTSTTGVKSWFQI